MKSVLDKITRDALIKRINSLDENTTALWGKMNIYQMLEHCIIWEEMASGKKKFKRSFLGRLFGKMALKDMIGNEKDLRHSMPTLPQLKGKENNNDIKAQKQKWIDLMEENAHSPNPEFVHPFCGKMTIEQTGYLAYKHSDHHLRQFGA